MPNDIDFRVTPLGGCGEFGMNWTCYQFAKKMIVVDAGVLFPDAHNLGIESIVPQVSSFFDQHGPPFAYFITHGHEDHIGALPFVVERWPAPIYATPWTKALIERKFSRFGISQPPPIHSVEAGDRIDHQVFSVEYVAVNHSIPHACALVIRAGGLSVFHSGDFKLDLDSTHEAPADIEQLREIGDRGIDLLLADSTNAGRPGDCPSENIVPAALERLMAGCQGVVFITTFASNLWRLRSVVETARKVGRKVFLGGYGVEATLSIASELGLYRPSAESFVSEDALLDLPRDRICFIASGCQAERRSAVARLSFREHRALAVEPGDTFVFSSRLIPGNEKRALQAMDRLRQQGATVITGREVPEIHVSGHGYQGDLDRLLECIRPTVFIPIHGSFTHLSENSSDSSVPEDRILIQSGMTLDVKKENGDIQVTKHEQQDIGLEFVDSECGHLLSYDVMRERMRVAELGAVLLEGVFDTTQQRWRLPATVKLIGLSLTRVFDESEESRILQTIEGRVMDAVERSHRQGGDIEALREAARVCTRRCLGDLLRKKPVVLPAIQILT